MAIENPYFYNDRVYPDEYYRREPRELIEERFRKKYTVHVEPSKRHYRHRSIPLSYNRWLEQGAGIPFQQEVEREPLLKVYVSKDNYEKLIETDQLVEELKQQSRDLHQMKQERQKEAHIRSSNPAVQKAYEKYQMLLKLCD